MPWIAEGWVAGPNGKAVKAQVMTNDEPDEGVLEQLRRSVGVLYYLNYRSWPDATVQPGTKVTQR